MNILNYTIHSEKNLIDIIRQTTLLGDKSIFPFCNSNINVLEVEFKDLYPAQSFVLKSQIENIKKINNIFSKDKINISELKGFLSFNLDNDNLNTYVFTPPIIEIIEGKPIIIDGMHRVFYNKGQGLKFPALLIENIPNQYYPYQLPLEGGWESVKLFNEELPDGFKRKEYRYPNGEHKKYFREYPFPGIIKIIRSHTGR